MALSYLQIPILEDNYVYLIRNEQSNDTYVVDPGLAQPVIDVLDKHVWKLTGIINTHHHWDHTDGNLEIKKHYQCPVYGFEPDAKRIPGITKFVNNNEELVIADAKCRILFTPGHTLGHICYYFYEDHMLFCGDTLFSCGCGRLFEGTPKQMMESLSKLRLLPDETILLCAHEYTEKNLNFALSLEPENKKLQDKLERVKKLRANDQSTVPMPLFEEKQLNPLLRWDDKDLRKSIGLENASDLEVFTYVRKKRDVF